MQSPLAIATLSLFLLSSEQLREIPTYYSSSLEFESLERVISHSLAILLSLYERLSFACKIARLTSCRSVRFIENLTTSRAGSEKRSPDVNCTPSSNRIPRVACKSRKLYNDSPSTSDGTLAFSVA